MLDSKIRLHHFEPFSQVNGPGARAVLWVQGCALSCPGCFNPETHDFTSGKLLPTRDLLDQILSGKDRIEGITVSGGEPAYQYRSLTTLFQEIRRQTRLSILVFSGFTLQELKPIPGIQAFLEAIDVLIAGRYDQKVRVANGLIGSANKSVHFISSRYSPHDLTLVPQAEVTISPQGEILISGIDPLQWK